MTSEEIEPRLTEVFRDIFDRGHIISPARRPAPISKLESLANISLVIAIEKEFNVSFSLKEIKALLDVGDMIDLIKAKRPKQ